MASSVERDYRWVQLEYISVELASGKNVCIRKRPPLKSFYTFAITVNHNILIMHVTDGTRSRSTAATAITGQGMLIRISVHTGHPCGPSLWEARAVLVPVQPVSLRC